MRVTSRRPALFAMLAAALLWGVWWVPVRTLGELGMDGVWAGVALKLGAAPLLIAAMAFGARRRVDPPDRPAAKAPAGGDWRPLLGAVFVGAAVMLYSASLVYTDVVRAVLLFYLAPAWSTLIEVLFFGRRFSWRSVAAISLSLTGAVVIFRGELGLGDWGVGDAMALLSGLLWSIGAALVFVAPAPSRRLSLVVCLSGAAVGAIMGLVAGEDLGRSPSLAELSEAAPYALGFGALYLAPILLATMWGARLLPPATVSFLLTAEIISGVASSAIWLDEPFGAPEVLGAVLVTTAALVEVFRADRSPGRSRDPALSKTTP